MGTVTVQLVLSGQGDSPYSQVWQCPEGHIICGSCADRPELLVLQLYSFTGFLYVLLIVPLHVPLIKALHNC